ncbi:MULTISPECIES: hypothetical protein [Streptosporangium]|uniref:Uncharacterized protein n=1 Tax=Streptosporangium brasiliense TaxID=47480 RepID=A0ABT9RNU1_9ACTN|nr:hypothetical protein [Streptosporangium brasiliense]MDP9870379.1 hypothetical protein [Streptosporangium brasiliense]
MRTIARNSKRVDEIKAACTVVTGFVSGCDENGRRLGQPVTWQEPVWEMLKQIKAARLIEHVEGKAYTIELNDKAATVIAVTAPATVAAGMDGITYTNDEGTTDSADVWSVRVVLDELGAPATLADIYCDGLETTVSADALSPEPYVRVPSAEYLAEQAETERTTEDERPEDDARHNWLTESADSFTLTAENGQTETVRALCAYPDGSITVFGAGRAETVSAWQLAPELFAAERFTLTDENGETKRVRVMYVHGVYAEVNVSTLEGKMLTTVSAFDLSREVVKTTRGPETLGVPVPNTRVLVYAPFNTITGTVKAVSWGKGRARDGVVAVVERSTYDPSHGVTPFVVAVFWPSVPVDPAGETYVTRDVRSYHADWKSAAHAMSDVQAEVFPWGDKVTERESAPVKVTGPNVPSAQTFTLEGSRFARRVLSVDPVTQTAMVEAFYEYAEPFQASVWRLSPTGTAPAHV